MDCFPLPAEQVLENNYLQQYQMAQTAFFSEMVQLNTTVFILDKVINFPFWLFGDGNGNVFFYMTILNGMEVVITITHRLLLDNESKAYSLPKFKNDIATHVKEQFAMEYRTHLRKARIEKKQRELLQKADRIRNNQIAHLNQSSLLDRTQIEWLHITEIDSIRDSLNGIYNCLCFNLENLFVPLSYAPNVVHPVGSDSRPDIVRMLDSIACNSSVLLMPESNPQLWEVRQQNYPPREREIINEYRIKCGLPAV